MWPSIGFPGFHHRFQFDTSLLIQQVGLKLYLRVSSLRPVSVSDMIPACHTWTTYIKLTHNLTGNYFKKKKPKEQSTEYREYTKKKKKKNLMPKNVPKSYCCNDNLYFGRHPIV